MICSLTYSTSSDPMRIALLISGRLCGCRRRGGSWRHVGQRSLERLRQNEQRMFGSSALDERFAIGGPTVRIRDVPDSRRGEGGAGNCQTIIGGSHPNAAKRIGGEFLEGREPDLREDRRMKQQQVLGR